LNIVAKNVKHTIHIRWLAVFYKFADDAPMKFTIRREGFSNVARSICRTFPAARRHCCVIACIAVHERNGANRRIVKRVIDYCTEVAQTGKMKLNESSTEKIARISTSQTVEIVAEQPPQIIATEEVLTRRLMRTAMKKLTKKPKRKMT